MKCRGEWGGASKAELGSKLQECESGRSGELGLMKTGNGGISHGSEWCIQRGRGLLGGYRSRGGAIWGSKGLEGVKGRAGSSLV